MKKELQPPAALKLPKGAAYYDVSRPVGERCLWLLMWFVGGEPGKLGRIYPRDWRLDGKPLEPENLSDEMIRQELSDYGSRGITEATRAYFEFDSADRGAWRFNTCNLLSRLNQGDPPERRSVYNPPDPSLFMSVSVRRR